MANATRGFRRTAPRRGMDWLGTAVDIQMTTGIFTTMVTEVELESFPNPMLIRQRGSFLIFDQGGANTDGIVALGLIVVTAKALAAGLASLPDPIGDAGSDWLWHTYLGFAVNAATSVQDMGTQVREVQVDGKAMRKIDRNMAIVLVGAASFSVAPSIRVLGGVRFLFKK